MQNKSMVGIDLFSGAGGMSIGAIAAGVDVQVAVELDKNAAITFKANHPHTKMYNQDIRTLQIDKTFKKKVKFKRLYSEGLLVKVFQQQTKRQDPKQMKIIGSLRISYASLNK